MRKNSSELTAGSSIGLKLAKSVSSTLYSENESSRTSCIGVSYQSQPVSSTFSVLMSPWYIYIHTYTVDNS